MWASVRQVHAAAREGIFTCFVAALLIPGPAAPAEPAGNQHKRILVLYDEDKDGLPGLARADRGLREAFGTVLGKSADIHSESLGLSHFDRPGYEDAVTEFFRTKYAKSPPDVIVAVLG